MISIDDFSKIEVRVGTVRSAERVPETDKLLRLMVEFGPAALETPAAPSTDEPTETLPLVAEPVPEMRQIVSGIAGYVADPETLVGMQLSFVTNLAPRTIRGIESNGMLFAVGKDDTFAFLVPHRPVPSGTRAH